MKISKETLEKYLEKHGIKEKHPLEVFAESKYASIHGKTKIWGNGQIIGGNTLKMLNDGTNFLNLFNVGDTVILYEDNSNKIHRYIIVDAVAYNVFQVTPYRISDVPLSVKGTVLVYV